MQENFDFHVKPRIPANEYSARQRQNGAYQEVHVVVRGTLVTVSGATGKLCMGHWDQGGYVRYADSQRIPVHPFLLDAIDGELRHRMTLKGIETRADPRRRSAVGYSNH